MRVLTMCLLMTSCTNAQRANLLLGTTKALACAAAVVATQEPDMSQDDAQQSGSSPKTIAMPRYVTDNLPPVGTTKRQLQRHDDHRHLHCKHPRTWHEDRWVYYYQGRWEFERVGQWYHYTSALEQNAIPAPD